jgi:uncharacterized membrane protein
LDLRSGRERNQRRGHLRSLWDIRKLAMSDIRFMLKVAGLSGIAGMRSMSGPAFLALNDKTLARTRVGRIISQSQKLKSTLQAMAVAELIFDKLPVAPKRTEALPLIARAASGALVGASLYATAMESPINGAIVGGCSALAAAKLSYEIRRFLTKNAHIPDTIVAIAEDALVISRGRKLLETALADNTRIVS